MLSAHLLVSLLVLIGAFSGYESVRLPPVARDDSDDNVNLKIINGEYAIDHSEFPYQAYLFTAWSKQCNKTTGLCQVSGSSCGGAIANSRYIITAAHCVMQGDRVATASSVVVSVGVDNKNEINPRKQSYRASQLWVHDGYTAAPSFHNDIAIIKLRGPISFNSGVQPACFNFVDQHYAYLVASGYGATSTQIQDANGNQVNQQAQGDRLKYAIFQEDEYADDCEEDFICINSYYAHSGDSICMGDSGGPLSTSTNADGKMQVIGVASNVVGLPNANGLMEFCVGYGKYTKLANQVDFIDSKIGKNNYCSIRS